MMTGTILVTGGSGFIAGYLIRQLAAEGWTINATIRSLAKADKVRALIGVPEAQLRFFAADLTSDAGWAEAVAGCSHVAHVASPFPAESKSQSKARKLYPSEVWASLSEPSSSRALMAAAFALGSASLKLITPYCQSPNNA